MRREFRQGIVSRPGRRRYRFLGWPAEITGNDLKTEMVKGYMCVFSGGTLIHRSRNVRVCNSRGRLIAECVTSGWPG